MRAFVPELAQTRASGADNVATEGGGFIPTLDWVGVRARQHEDRGAQ
jgi:hypothetical protein